LHRLRNVTSTFPETSGKVNGATCRVGPPDADEDVPRRSPPFDGPSAALVSTTAGKLHDL
jgi:hypothetical protein